METKFTKQRWIPVGDDIFADGNKIATIFKPKHESQVLRNGESQSEMWLRTQEERESYRIEKEANLKLIAAAPTMYKKHNENDELCSQMIDLIRDNSDALNLLAKIKSNCCTAIQKATE